MNQTQINPRAGLTFHSVLRALLRQDPDIVMVGEIRDAETAEIALKAAQTGHLVLSTLHTNSTSETLTRLQQMGIARWMISSALSLVIAQRLVRKLCPHCRRNAGSAADLPHSLWPRPLPRWQAAGCGTLLPRILRPAGAVRSAACYPRATPGDSPGLNAIEIESLARAAGMMTLFESGCQAIEQGLTSLEEVVRVLGIPMATKRLWRWRGIDVQGAPCQGDAMANQASGGPAAPPTAASHTAGRTPLCGEAEPLAPALQLRNDPPAGDPAAGRPAAGGRVIAAGAAAVRMPSGRRCLRR